jgi:hypothetical protein
MRSSDKTTRFFAVVALLVSVLTWSGLTPRSWAAPNYPPQGASGGGGLNASTAVTSVTGTSNQVVASAAVGDVTLSLPQSIATGSTPTFASLTLSQAGGGGGSPSILFGGATSSFPSWKRYATQINARLADDSARLTLDVDTSGQPIVKSDGVPVFIFGNDGKVYAQSIPDGLGLSRAPDNKAEIVR